MRPGRKSSDRTQLRLLKEMRKRTYTKNSEFLEVKQSVSVAQSDVVSLVARVDLLENPV